MIDCARGTSGWGGGYSTCGFSYVAWIRGINPESTYPYEAENGIYRYKPTKSDGYIEGLVLLPKDDEDALQVGTIGPVAISYFHLKLIHIFIMLGFTVIPNVLKIIPVIQF